MCRATTVIRRTLGIQDYRPGRPVLIRKPTRCGARSRPLNGVVLIGGFGTPENAVIADLARQHRQIRQMADDTARRRARGRDA